MTTKKRDETLMDLLAIKLQALYDMEQQLVKALPRMAKASTHPALKKGFEDHLKETKNHVVRLEGAFRILGAKAKTLKGDAIRGLIEDAKWCMKHTKNKHSRDAQLIAAASYVEHYEMAGYLSAIAWATELRKDGIVQLLQETLNEEESADEKLAALSAIEVLVMVPKEEEPVSSMKK